MLVEPVEDLGLILTPENLTQNSHAPGGIDQRVLAKINKHHRHARSLQAVNQRPVMGTGAVALKTENGQVCLHGQHTFQTETVSRGMPHPRNIRERGKRFQILGIAPRIRHFEIRQQPGKAIRQLLPFQYGKGRNVATLAQYHSLDTLGHLYRPPRQIGNRVRRQGELSQ